MHASLLGLLVGASCRQAEEKPRASATPATESAKTAGLPTVFDLVERFDAAEAFANTTEINFGTTEAIPHLIRGWGPPEQTKGTPVSWAMGRRSAFWFFSADRRATRMSCRIWPFIYGDKALQVVEMTLNGHPLAKIELARRPKTYWIDIPEEFVVAGKNRLDLDYAYSGKPSQEAGEDTRPLSVLWDWVRFELPQVNNTPRIDRGDDGPSIVVPPGSGLEYFFKIPSGAAIEFSHLRSLDRQHAATLEVRIRTDSRKDDKIIKFGTTSASLEAVPLETTGVARILLLSPPTGPRAKTGSGLVIGAPRIVAPPGGARETGPGAEQALPLPLPENPSEKPPNVVIYLIDALRADHLGAYGYGKDTSPNIDAFASDAIKFENAIAQTSWTRPAVASVLTGLSMPSHGIIGMKTALPASVSTIAEVLRSNGYTTAAYTRNAQVSRETGFSQGFDHFALVPNDSDFESQVAQHLAEAAAPFFFYLHTIEPHAPYDAEEPHRTRFAEGVDPAVGSVENVQELGSQAFTSIFDRNFTAKGSETRAGAAVHPHKDALIALYDAEVASADARFGRLLEQLRTLGMYDETVIVLLADHGEEFYDHDRLSHGMTLYRELTRVPLMIKFPASWEKGRSVAARVSQLDIMPTVLDLAQIETPEAAEGRSLLPLAQGQQPVSENPAYSYLDWFGGHAESVVAEGAKLIHNLESGPLLRPRYELYDLSSDPFENNDIAASKPVLTGYLASLLRESKKRPTKQPHIPDEAPILDPAFRERMRALGYAE